MNAELRQFITENRFYQATIEEVARRLPPEDAELEAWVAETVAQSDQKNFMFLIAAAFHRERRLSAQHLAGGAVLFPDPWWLGQAVWRLEGAVPEQLLAAIKSARLAKDIAAAGLLSGAVWCEEHRGGELPAEWIAEARMLARSEPQHLPTEALLTALGVRRKDAGLLAVVKQRYPGLAAEKWEQAKKSAVGFGNNYLERARGPARQLVAEKPPNELASGSTVRRAVARIGRNDPCPCGSGKKYKQCCHARDQERLRHSSEVAGLTQEELSATPEVALTRARLKNAEPHLLARFDPTKIPAELLETYFIQMSGLNLLDGAVTALEQLGYAAALEESWDYVALFATRAGRRDVLERLVQLRQVVEPEFTEAELDLGDRLLLAEEDAGKCLQLLDDAAQAALQTEDVEELLGFAYGVTISRHRALGIFLYRSIFPLVPPERAAAGFEQLLEARDRLQLSPDDPFSDLIDERLGETKDEAKDAAALELARQKLDAKAREVQDLKESMAQMQREILRREAPVTPAPVAPAPPSPGEERALKQMREKVEGLKALLKDRHNERNTVRREFQKAQADWEAVRQQAAPASVPELLPAEKEAELLLPAEAVGNQPVRLMEFPKDFQQTLARVPRPVARAAVIMIGRLAAGEPAAFVGALRLKATPNVMRQRIGSDFRLLFRLWSDRLEVIDLINRKDLDRRLKTLT